MSKLNLNLLTRLLSPKDIHERLSASDKFSYNISEGGYVSHDVSVVVITDRQPYVGMVIQYCPCVSEEKKSYWINYLEELFSIEGGN